MTNKAAGNRLRRHLREGMAAVGIETMTELSRKSGVGRDTLQVWLRGDRAPSATAGQKVAAAIGGSYNEMMRVWEDGNGATDPEAIVAALEWAIRLVRSGQVPPDVQREIEDAQRSAKRLPRRRGPR